MKKINGESIFCDSMHERKQKMFELSEGFLALPGGLGTLEEICEMLTWQQLGLHQFPIGFLNVNSFFNHLDALFSEMERKHFLKPEGRAMALFHEDISELLNLMQNYKPAQTAKWINLETS